MRRLLRSFKNKAQSSVSRAVVCQILILLFYNTHFFCLELETRDNQRAININVRRINLYMLFTQTFAHLMT